MRGEGGEEENTRGVGSGEDAVLESAKEKANRFLSRNILANRKLHLRRMWHHEKRKGSGYDDPNSETKRRERRTLLR